LCLIPPPVQSFIYLSIKRRNFPNSYYSQTLYDVYLKLQCKYTKCFSILQVFFKLFYQLTYNNLIYQTFLKYLMILGYNQFHLKRPSSVQNPMMIENVEERIQRNHHNQLYQYHQVL